MLRIGDREIVLVGTAHVSRESAELVREVIQGERPDCVCVELDTQRHAALEGEVRFEALDLREVLRRRQLATLILSLMLAAYQRQLGGRLGVMPGTELAAATRTARELGIPFVLCDRDVRVTLRRAWRALSLWKKSLLLSTFLAALFEKRELDEEELRELRQQDVLTRLVDELGRAFPAIKHVLIDERDAYLAEKMRCAPGRRIVAVVGAGHVRGLRDALAGARPRELAPLETVPPLSPVWKWLGWGVPALILGAIGAIAWRSGLAAAGDSLVAWALATGLPSLAGAIVAWSHPLTMLSALTTAPLTTLTPVIGVGHVAAFVQAWARPPFVHEFQSLADDVLSLPRWWSNRLLRVFLAFLLTTLGASIGTWLGGARLLAALLG